MMRNKGIMSGYFAPLIIILLLSLQFVPHLASDWNIGRDSGVWMYSSWLIMEGQVLYKDVWDHKPPTIFLVNLIGLLLDRDGGGGVAILELLFLVFSYLLLYVLLRDLYSREVAFFALIVLIIGFRSVGFGENTTSSYAVLPIVISMYLLYRSERLDRWVGFVLGLMLAITLTLKMNLLLLQVLALTIHSFSRICLGWKYRQLLVRESLTILMGSSLVIGIYMIYFILTNSFNDMWSAVIIYNISYGGLDFSLSNIVALFNNLELVLCLAVAGFLVTAVQLRDVQLLCVNTRHRFLLIILIAFIADVILLVFSSRSFSHYYQVLLPTSAVLIGASVNYIANQVVTHTSTPAGRFSLSPSTPFLVGLLLVPLSLYIGAVYGQLREIGNRDAELSKGLDLIMECTDPGDYLLMWGADSTVNFLTKRKSPSKFVYQYPLFAANYTNDTLVSEFVHDVAGKLPVLIIDTNNVSIPPLSREERKQWIQVTRNGFYFQNDQLMDQFDRLIEDDYKHVGTLKALDWDVYQSKHLTQRCAFGALKAYGLDGW